MLAEQVSSIDSRLSQEFRGTAHVLSGELAWAAPDALRVIDWLQTQGSAVVGVELCRDKDGTFSFLASSDYSPAAGERVTSAELARCAEAAARFIADFGQSPEDLFTLTWLPPVPEETAASLAA